MVATATNRSGSLLAPPAAPALAPLHADVGDPLAKVSIHDHVAPGTSSSATSAAAGGGGHVPSSADAATYVDNLAATVVSSSNAQRVPVVTRLAAERGLQAAAEAWRETHSVSSRQQRLLFLGSQGGLAAVVVVVVAVALVWRSRRRLLLGAPRDDSDVEERSTSPKSASAKKGQDGKKGPKAASTATASHVPQAIPIS